MIVWLMVLTLASVMSWAQELPAEKQMKTESADAPEKVALHDAPSSSSHFMIEKKLVPDVLADQKAFWTRPFHPRAADINWFVPFAATTSLMIGSDRSIEAKLPSGANFINHSQTFSNVGVASLVAIGGGIYLLGRSGA